MPVMDSFLLDELASPSAPRHLGGSQAAHLKLYLANGLVAARPFRAGLQFQKAPPKYKFCQHRVHAVHQQRYASIGD